MIMSAILDKGQRRIEPLLGGHGYCHDPWNLSHDGELQPHLVGCGCDHVLENLIRGVSWLASYFSGT